MNEALYDAVFCYGEKKVDPFAKCYVDFDRIISDMKLVGYELNSFNIVHQIMLEQLDDLIRTKGKAIEEAMDLENRDAYCREKFGLSFKDIDALDPTNDIEWDDSEELNQEVYENIVKIAEGIKELRTRGRQQTI